MPTIVKTDSGNWKAVIRKAGFPAATKTFRLKRTPAERMLFDDVMARYLQEVTPTKRPFTQQSEKHRAATLKRHFGKYSLAGITAELVAKFCDECLAGLDRLAAKGKLRPRAATTVRLELWAAVDSAPPPAFV